MASMVKEFRDFAVKGNMIDLAIGVIIGAAFGKIVESLVGDIFMPVIGAVSGGLDFSNYFVPLSSSVNANALADAKKQGAVLAWGNFVTIAINFLIVALAVFLLVKQVNRLKSGMDRPAAAPPTTRECPFCVSTISLKATRCPNCTSQLSVVGS